MPLSRTHLAITVGEKIVRECKMLEGAKVSLSDVKDEIIIQGNDIEKVSQSAASITDKTRVKDKDIRKFLGMSPTSSCLLKERPQGRSARTER